MKYSLGICNFLEDISSLSYSIVFLYFFALITKEGFLSLLAILWNSTFRWVYFSFSSLPLASLLLSAIYMASSDNHFAFLHFFFLRMVLITASCAISWTSTHSSSGTLSIRSNLIWIYLSLPLYNCKWFDLVVPEWSSSFPYFFNLSLNLAIRSSWSKPQSAPGLVFAACIALLHLWLQRI